MSRCIHGGSWNDLFADTVTMNRHAGRFHDTELRDNGYLPQLSTAPYARRPVSNTKRSGGPSGLISRGGY